MIDGPSSPRPGSVPKQLTEMLSFYGLLAPKPGMDVYSFGLCKRARRKRDWFSLFCYGFHSERAIKGKDRGGWTQTEELKG